MTATMSFSLDDCMFDEMREYYDDDVFISINDVSENIKLLHDKVIQFVKDNHVSISIESMSDKGVWIMVPIKHMTLLLREYLLNAYTVIGKHITLVAPPINMNGNSETRYSVKGIPNAFTEYDYKLLVRLITKTLIDLNIKANQFRDYDGESVIRNYVQETIMNPVELAYKNVLNNTFIPCIHFPDYERVIYLLDESSILIKDGLIYTNDTMSNCYKDMSVVDVHSVLLKWTNGMEKYIVFTVNDIDDAEFIKTVINVTDTNERRLLTVKYLSNSVICNACKKLYRDGIRNEIIRDLITIHDNQNGMKNDKVEYPEHPPEYDLPVPLLPELIKLGKELSTSLYTGKVFVTEFDGMVRRFI